MPLIKANGIDISYEVYRPARQAEERKNAVVLVNGLADGKETWSLQLPALLEAQYPVLTYDNRGVGGSSRPAGPYTSEVLAADLVALVDALESEEIARPFHLVGVSMGGMVAQRYALARPGEVRSLTLACTYAAPNVFCRRRFAIWADMARALGVGFVMKDVAAWGFTRAFFEPEHRGELEEFDAAMAQLDVTTEQYLSQLNVIQVFDAREEVHRLGTLPVLVVAGEEDILIPTGLSKELSEMIPGSQWATVRGGHCCLWEFPASFNGALLEFLHGRDKLS